MESHWLPRPGPLSLDDYLALDEQARRDIEVVEGTPVPREQRSRAHQKTGFRIAEAFEGAVAKFRRDHTGGTPPCYEVNTEVDVILWEGPLTLRKPDVVVHHCLDAYARLHTADVLVIIEVLSPWSDSRDRIHKKGEYAKAGIPHYFIVQFDEVGATSVEHYALLENDRAYSTIGVTHRDRNVFGITITTPFAAQIQWQDLEVAPRT